jgi:MFS family permease
VNGGVLWRIALILGIGQLGFATILPLLPLYLTERLGASVKLVGVVIASFALVETFFKTAWGGVADRYGRKPIILIGLALSAIAPLLMSFLRAPILFVPLRLVDGMGSATLWPSSAAAVADSTAPAQRATGMAVLNTAFLGGMAIGPALGLFVAGAAGDPRAGFYLASALFALAIVLAAALFPATHNHEGAHSAAAGAAFHAGTGHVRTFIDGLRASRMLSILYFVAFVQMFGVGILIPIAAIYAKQVLGLHETAIGVLFLAVTIAVALAGVPGGRLADRIGKPKLVTIGMLIGTVGMWLLPFGGGLLGLVTAGVLLGVSYAFVFPAWLALITELAPPGRLGLAIGTSETVQGLGVVLGPLLGGLLWDTLGPQAPFIACAIALTAGTVIAAAAMRRRRCDSGREAAAVRGRP